MPLSSVSTNNGSLMISWTFPAPAQAVWAGFTDAALLSQWLGNPIECDVRAGGSVVVDHGGGCLSRSVVTERDQPRRLAMTWKFPDEPVSRISIELHAGDSHSELTFVHHDLGTFVDSYGPGWITHFTYLEAAIGGEPIPHSRFWPLHTTLEALYVRCARVEQRAG